MSTTPADALDFDDALHSRGRGLSAGARAAYSLSMKINPAKIADLGKASLPRCVQCGYLLVGLSASRCPECGEEINWPMATAIAMEPRMSLASLARRLHISALLHTILIAPFALAGLVLGIGICWLLSFALIGLIR